MDTILSSAVRFHPERGAQTGVASARVRDLPAPRTGQMHCDELLRIHSREQLVDRAPEASAGVDLVIAATVESGLCCVALRVGP
jgi:hypothetical protein